MFNLGPMELAIILVLALLVFGPKKLPEIGKGVGQAMREFKRASRDLMDSFNDAMDDRPRPAAVADGYHSPSSSVDSTYPYQPAGEAASQEEPQPGQIEPYSNDEPAPIDSEHDSNYPASAPMASEPAPAEPEPAAVAAAADEPGQPTANAPERTT
jgi:sec-independent protein translocase protein TatA